MFVEAEFPGVDLEEFFLSGPVLTFATHAFAQNARVQFAAARVADAISLATVSALGYRDADGFADWGHS